MKAISKIIILMFLPALLLGGCGIYAEYERPDTSFCDSLYTAKSTDTLASEYGSIADAGWSVFFRDTLLQKLIRTGLENNSDIKIARLRTDQAIATLESARLGYFPSVSFSADASLSPGSISLTPQAQWEVDIFGRLTNAKRSAKAQVEKSYAYEQAVHTQLVATIASGYYNLLMLDEQIRITYRTIDTWEESIRTLSALKRAGKTNEAAIMQSKANKLKIEGSLLTLKRQLIELENNLCTLLGIPPQRIERGKIEEQSFPTSMCIGVPADLLCKRPDIIEAEMNLAQAFYATNVSLSNFYPQITLSGTGGWVFNGTSTPAGFVGNLLGSLVQPIFSKGYNKAQLKISRAKQEEALLTFRQTVLDAGTEVNNALVRWQTAKERINLDKQEIVCLKAAVWNTTLLMKHGNTNYLEVLTAQQTLLSAELTAVADWFDQVGGIIELYRALGGGARS